MKTLPPSLRKGFQGLSDAMDAATAALMPTEYLTSARPAGMLSDCGCSHHPKGLHDISTDTKGRPGGNRQDRDWERRAVDIDAKEIVGRTIPNTHRITDPWLVRDLFGLHAIEFGRWMSEEDRQKWLLGTTVSLVDLSDIIRRPKAEMGMGKALTVALGSRGRGGNVISHYEPDYNVINITRTHGAGRFAHEYAKAIVDAVRDVEKVPALSGPALPFPGSAGSDDTLNGLIETIFHKLFYEDKKLTPFARKLQKAGTHPEVVWVRTFEAWISKELKEKLSVNLWLCQPWEEYEKKKEYPSADDLDRANRWIVLFLRKAFDTIRDGKAKPKTEGAIRGDAVTIETQQESIKGGYALMELDDLVTSHNPATFKENPQYPSGCQQRDYTADKSEQHAAIRAAQSFNPRFLVTDAPSATDGPPVVTPAGIVLGGNKRTMILKLTKDYDRYLEYLYKAIGLFGMTKNDLDQFAKPVLVRMIDIEMTQCAFYSNILNRGLTQAIDVTTETISYGRQLGQSDLEAIAQTLQESGAESFSKAMDKKSVEKSVVTTFRRAGIITDRNNSQWVDPKSGELSQLGRLMVQQTLLGTVLPDKRLIDSAASYTNQIIRALLVLVKMAKWPSEWSLMPLIQEAIRAESSRRSSGTPKDVFIRSISFDRKSMDRATNWVWNAMDAPLSSWVQFVQYYTNHAAKEIELVTGSDFGFAKPRTRDEVIEAAGKQANIESPDGGAKGVAGHGAGHGAVRLGDRVDESGTQTINLRGPLRRWLGPVKHPSSILMWGDAGGGKSSLALVIATEWNRIGPVLYVMSEERIASKRMEARARRMRVSPPSLWRVEAHSLDAARQAIRAGTPAGPYALVVIDSVNDVSSKPLEVLGLLKEFPGQSFILIAQSDKVADKYAGPAKWKHAVDIIIEADAGTARTTKNRDGDLGTYRIW